MNPLSIEAARDFALGDKEFAYLARSVKERAGIVLGPHKRNLVYSRLSRRLRALNMDSFTQYCELLMSDQGEAEVDRMVNAITTNLTGFFRERHHFEHLGRTVVPALIARAKHGDKPRLRIWSAGCSSGEEPYSIAMTLRAQIPNIDRWDVRILATDIDTDMLEHAAGGIYDDQKAAAIPKDLRSRYVEPLGGGAWRMDDSLRSLISFKPLNLLGAWPMRGPFDAIFCRNVVIYFDKAAQIRLFDRFANLLAREGWLYIGHSETLYRVSERFDPAGRTIYRRRT